MKYSDDQGKLMIEHPMRSEEIVIFSFYAITSFSFTKKRKTNILIEKKQERIIYLRESEC
jgi:hypothetical protein